MFGSSARSLRQVLPPENIMSYRVSIGLLRRRLLLRPDAHLSANKVQSAANNNRRRLCGILRIELRHFLDSHVWCAVLRLQLFACANGLYLMLARTAEQSHVTEARKNWKNQSSK
jgi:uncharacterized protein HemY